MRILVFGITGSIGKSLLKVLEPHQLVGISYNKNHAVAKQIIDKYKIEYFYTPVPNYSSVDSIEQLIIKSKPDLIVNAVTGVNGLIYTKLSLEAKIDLALANKESLVMAGKFVKELAYKNNTSIYPIDSEHSSLYELLIHQDINNIDSLTITCSGGSCYTKTNTEIKALNFEDVIKHPNWSMGEKISCDSATLINKCFEIVECYHLFNTKNINAIYHPQSIVHALINFKHGSTFANLSKPDMCLSIKLAINKYQINDRKIIDNLGFHQLKLEFDQIDKNKWKPIQWAQDIIEDENNCLGIIINVANEITMQAFKENKLRFDQYYSNIQKYIKKYKNYKVNNFNDVFVLIDLINKDI